MSKDPNEIYIYATELFEAGKYAEAEPLLRSAIEDNPRYADVLNKLGIITYLKGQMHRAAEYFERALALNPQYTEASLNLAITYNELGDFDG